MSTIFAWSNILKQSGTWGANSSAPNMGASNMASDIGSASVAWQTAAGVTTLSAGALFNFTPAISAQLFRVLGIFRTNISSAGTVTFQLVRDGSIIYSQAVSVAAGYGQVISVLPSDTTADQVQIFVNDADNPQGFINIPLAFAGPAFIPTSAISWNSTRGRDDQSSSITSRGGQEYITNYWQKRRWDISMDSIRANEVWTGIDAMDMVARTGQNVLFIPNDGSAYLQQESVFGLLKSTSDLAFPFQSADRRSWSATITERL